MEGEIEQVQPEQKSSKKKWIILGSSLFAIIVIIFVVVIVFSLLNKGVKIPQECEGFGTEIQDKIAYEECITDLAITKDDEKICKKSLELNTNCMRELVIYREDLDACSQFTGGTGEYCEGGVAKDRTYCENQYPEGSTERAVCLWGVADRSLDIELCKELNVFASCLDRIALEKKDYNVCYEYEDISEDRYHDNESKQIQIDYCLGDLATELEDIEICKLISDSSLRKRNCIHDIAVSKLNAGYCDYLDDYDWVSCMKDVGIKKSDENLCDLIKLETIENKNLAEDKSGLGRSGYSISSARNTCFEFVAKEKNDENICLMIEEGFGEFCITNIAVKKEDVELCEKIEDEDTKRFCITRLTNNYIDFEECDEKGGKSYNGCSDGMEYIATIKGVDSSGAHSTGLHCCK